MSMSAFDTQEQLETIICGVCPSEWLQTTVKNTFITCPITGTPDGEDEVLSTRTLKGARNRTSSAPPKAVFTGAQASPPPTPRVTRRPRQARRAAKRALKIKQQMQQEWQSANDSDSTAPSVSDLVPMPPTESVNCDWKSVPEEWTEQNQVLDLDEEGSFFKREVVLANGEKWDWEIFSRNKLEILGENTTPTEIDLLVSTVKGKARLVTDSHSILRSDEFAFGTFKPGASKDIKDCYFSISHWAPCCKHFQNGTCNRSEGRCNFVHVKPPVEKAPPTEEEEVVCD